MNNKIKKPDVLITEKAVVNATKKIVNKKLSPIYEDVYGVRYQFKPIKPFILEKSIAHVKKLVLKNKPNAPMQKISGKEQPNKNHPEYLAELEIWEREKAEIENDGMLYMEICAMLGIVLLDPIPDKELWLDDVINDIFVGLATEEDKKDFMKELQSSYRTEQQMLESVYKKYVLLDIETTNDFTNFYNLNGGGTTRVSSELAVDTFQTTT